MTDNKLFVKPSPKLYNKHTWSSFPSRNKQTNKTKQVVKWPQGRSLGWEDPLEKEMATHSSTLVWKIPWKRSLVRYSPWGCKESDFTLTVKWSEVLYLFTEVINKGRHHLCPKRVWKNELKVKIWGINKKYWLFPLSLSLFPLIRMSFG